MDGSDRLDLYFFFEIFKFILYYYRTHDFNKKDFRFEPHPIQNLHN